MAQPFHNKPLENILKIIILYFVKIKDFFVIVGKRLSLLDLYGLERGFDQKAVSSG
ncbi:MAG: hypothetical protein ACOCXS_01965 [Bacteroidota bacterium]